MIHRGRTRLTRWNGAKICKVKSLFGIFFFMAPAPRGPRWRCPGAGSHLQRLLLRAAGWLLGPWPRGLGPGPCGPSKKVGKKAQCKSPTAPTCMQKTIVTHVKHNIHTYTYYEHHESLNNYSPSSCLIIGISKYGALSSLHFHQFQDA